MYVYMYVLHTHIHTYTHSHIHTYTRTADVTLDILNPTLHNLCRILLANEAHIDACMLKSRMSTVAYQDEDMLERWLQHTLQICPWYTNAMLHLAMHYGSMDDRVVPDDDGVPIKRDATKQPKHSWKYLFGKALAKSHGSSRVYLAYADVLESRGKLKDAVKMYVNADKALRKEVGSDLYLGILKHHRDNNHFAKGGDADVTKGDADVINARNDDIYTVHEAIARFKTEYRMPVGNKQKHAKGSKEEKPHTSKHTTTGADTRMDSLSKMDPNHRKTDGQTQTHNTFMDQIDGDDVDASHTMRAGVVGQGHADQFGAGDGDQREKYNSDSEYRHLNAEESHNVGSDNDVYAAGHDSSFMQSIAHAVDAYSHGTYEEGGMHDGADSIKAYNALSNVKSSHADDARSTTSRVGAAGGGKGKAASKTDSDMDMRHRDGRSRAVSRGRNGGKREARKSGESESESDTEDRFKAYGEMHDVFDDVYGAESGDEDMSETMRDTKRDVQDGEEGDAKPPVAVFEEVGVGRGLGRLTKADLSMREREIAVQVQLEREKDEMERMYEVVTSRKKAAAGLVKKRELTYLER
jgi:hypothetical protein